MESEYKFVVMHEQSSNSDNLVITESLHTNHHSSHTLSQLNMKSLTKDNHKQLEVTKHNQSALNNNCTFTKATNTVVRGIVDFKKHNIFHTPRHGFRKESSTAAVVLSYSEDSFNNNNNCDVISTSNTGVGIMSHQNFVLSFDQQTPSPMNACETLLSPAEAPFGRRYAEISQFKNHPNVEWSIDDNNEPQDRHQPESFYDDVDTTKPESVMDISKEKSDDEDLLLANDNLSKEFFESNAESSSDGGVLAEGEDETSSSESETSRSPSPQCDISLMERLLRTHPVWFLPGLQRGGSVHLLQGKEIGAFIVRGSSQKNTMAISVRLPRDAGPYIEHYLIQSNEGLLNLESSRFKFDSIPALVAHYSNCCDELPVQLNLPRGLRDAKNRQQLMSLALLGSEFWRCPAASPEAEETSLNSQNKSPTETSGISTMELTSSLKQKNSIFSKFSLRGNSNNSSGNNNNNGNQQLVETPSDTASSLSSFVVSGGHSTILSPQSPDSVFLTSPALEFCNLKSNSNSISNLNSPSGIIGKTSTFKAQTFSASQKVLQNRDINSDFQHNVLALDVVNKRDDIHNEEFVQRTRPTPPNTLNLAIASSRAPVPPKRWLKPTVPPVTSPFVEQNTMQTNNNFTVTTTVTFNVLKQQNHTSEIEIPPRNVPIISERLSPEGGESKTNSDSSLQKWELAKSPMNPFKTNESVRSKRHNGRRKESKHYQESDILESPSVYCRSNLGDKISDYEDLWTQENNNSRSSLHIALDTPKNNEILSPMVISPPQQLTPTVGSEVAIMTNNSPLQPTKLLFDNKRSPFYSDPVDVVAVFAPIVRREPKPNPLPSFHRYSEPPKGQFEDMNFHSSPIEQKKGFTPTIVACSLDHLQPPYKPVNNHRLDPTWTVDSSWEFVDVDKNDDSSESSSVRNLKQMTPQNSLQRRVVNQQRKMNTIERQNCAMSVDSYLMNSKKSNVYKLVAKKYPEINLKVPSTTVPSNSIPSTWQTFDSDCSNKFQRLSSYDNVVEQQSVYGGSFHNSAPSEDGTLFSEPWDSSQWDSFLPTTDDSSTIHLSKCRPAISEDETIIEDSSIISRSNANTIQRNPLLHPQKVATVLRSRSSFYRDREILKHPRNKAEKNDPGDGVEAYTLALAQDESSIFAKNIYNFIACTRESREKIPHKVMRNIRQFMNGMKNYLVKHGEKDFGIEVDKARASLKHDEFLNLDQILEGVMHQLVILPLKEYLYELFVDYYGTRGDIELIISNMKFAENKDPQAFGVKKGLKTPPPQALNRISMLFAKLQEAELPFEKLDFLLTAMTMILDNTIDPESESNDVRHFGCDDFLPLLAYVLCKCGFHFAEIEAEYIWGLMMPTVMNGQAGYYTTSLCSAAVSLKEFKQQYANPEGILVPNNSLECSVLRIIIPNEYNGSIQTKTIPVRPHTTTKDVIRIIAHKSQITNAMDYGLFKLIEGEETLLMDNDCPQDIRLASAGKHCTLVFRRFDSKIAWPKQ